MSKVAVATTDGISINEHFGKAKEFWIYEVDESAYTFLERRENGPHCTQDATGHTAGATAELLADVEVVLVIQIGPRAERELRRQGVIALPVTGSIDKALKAYGKRGKFIKNSILKTAVDCRSSEGNNGSCGCSQGCK
ncbi:MAG TPA: NifB/NifX family molybdenum-iron cluster-binding protein [Methylomusa anaerophila]|uniref:Dinitrogenase iron-molybdenum cofactor n=1 Tax=Methylomusa anaerophila TaxID=1930071 RepID=A0A348AEY9_9FIRM|nr:NifB/NifX family molybdenum-iron cluster-binding protein [Methylomusa anaerophila]BBB89637.1 dinitrogenase iron-molybdenum cofactor [Methylomusa anaerophila]HML89587.1 NifB/NifX family molybdenum-iron cluster-binding protein [Methylomusa anaerophila]